MNVRKEVTAVGPAQMSCASTPGGATSVLALSAPQASQGHLWAQGETGQFELTAV